MKEFKDHFSKQAVAYARFRPTYPKELFTFLSRLTGEHQLAWDCGTGNGQCAIQLVDFFDRVFASDQSPQQLKNVFPHERIRYHLEAAEAPLSLDDGSVDLVTVAQALHWFNFEKFYAQVKRVLKPQGIIAAWAYGLPMVSPAIDQILKAFHDETVGKFWLAENRLIDSEYSTIPFPFVEIEAPPFYITQEASLDALAGHVSTWSATQKYMEHFQENPIPWLMEKLNTVWQSSPESPKELRWKLILKIGKME